MRRDLHFRVTEREYRALVEYAARTDESLATVLRRMIRHLTRTDQKSGTPPVPEPLAAPSGLARNTSTRR
jgi:hypothetical protein